MIRIALLHQVHSTLQLSGVKATGVLGKYYDVSFKKETCCGCLKNINIGQSINECDKYNCVIYTKCYKLSKFAKINDNYYCQSCKSIVEIRYYNLFKFDYNDAASHDTVICLNLKKFLLVCDNTKTQDPIEIDYNSIFYIIFICTKLGLKFSYKIYKLIKFSRSGFTIYIHCVPVF